MGMHSLVIYHVYQKCIGRVESASSVGYIDAATESIQSQSMLLVHSLTLNQFLDYKLKLQAKLKIYAENM